MPFSIIDRVAAAQNTLDFYKDKPFAWGSADCVHIVAHCYREITGLDLLKGVRRYSTALGAARAMRKAGVEDFAAYLNTKFEPIAPAAALAGDIIAVPSDHPGMAHALGISVGHNLIFTYAPSPDGDGGFAGVAGVHVASHAWRAA